MRKAPTGLFLFVEYFLQMEYIIGIISNEIFQGPGYIDIKESDFAIRVQGAILTLQ